MEIPSWDDYKDSDNRFTDLDFNHNKDSIYWGDMDEVMPSGLGQGSEIFWMRA